MNGDEKGKSSQGRGDGPATGAAYPKYVKDGKRQQRKQPYHRPPKADTFQGSIEALKGHVYTYDGLARASQFKETTKKVGEWANQNCSMFPLDIWMSIQNLTTPDPDSWKPSAPEDPEDVVDAAIFKEEVQEYTKRKRAYRDNCTKCIQLY